MKKERSIVLEMKKISLYLILLQKHIYIIVRRNVNALTLILKTCKILILMIKNGMDK